jgi:hypothetical protein
MKNTTTNASQNMIVKIIGIMFWLTLRQHPENCVNEVRQKDRTFYIRLKNTQL